MANDIAWAQPTSYSFSNSTLAAQSRLKPFFEKYGLDFQNIATVSYVAGELRKMVIPGNIRESHIVRLNSKYFPRGEIEIGKEIEIGSLSSGKKYLCIIFDFKKEKKQIKALFLKDYTNLSPQDKDELKKFKIKNDTDIGHLSWPGLEGVWLINPGTQPPATGTSTSQPTRDSQGAPADLTGAQPKEPESQPLAAIPRKNITTALISVFGLAVSAGLGVMARNLISQVVWNPQVISVLAGSAFLLCLWVYVFIISPYIRDSKRDVSEDWKKVQSIRPAIKAAGIVALVGGLCLALGAAFPMIFNIFENEKIANILPMITSPTLFCLADIVTQKSKIRRAQAQKFDFIQCLIFTSIGLFAGLFCPAFFGFVRNSLPLSLDGPSTLVITGALARTLFLSAFWVPLSNSTASFLLWIRDLFNGKTWRQSAKERSDCLSGINGYMLICWPFWGGITSGICGDPARACRLGSGSAEPCGFPVDDYLVKVGKQGN